MGIAVAAASCASPKPEAVFLVKPYLQIGREASGGRLELRWETDDTPHRFEVQTRANVKLAWRAPEPARQMPVTRPDTGAYMALQAELRNLVPDGVFWYRVLRDGHEVFGSWARAPRKPDAPSSFAVTGDCGSGSDEEKAIAYQIFRRNPDYVAIAGDVVYSNGRLGEYRRRLYPFFNADTESVQVGAPLMRSVPVVSAPGNHDIAGGATKRAGDLMSFPDGMAWFLEWSQPLNGPPIEAGSPSAAPILGPSDRQEAFRAAAGTRYPRMANFSFEYGGVHWTILDSNPYVDWTSEPLRNWLKDDIRRAHRRWHVVMFHHASFHSSRQHFSDQQMRVLADVFQTSGVDVVFSGHVHNYQRSYPLLFTPRHHPDGSWRSVSGEVDGTFVTDRPQNSARYVRPRGVVYVVSGAGGAPLYDGGQDKAPETWQPFTARMRSLVHSFTFVNADDNKLRFTQIDVTGREIDRFSIER